MPDGVRKAFKASSSAPSRWVAGGACAVLLGTGLAGAAPPAAATPAPVAPHSTGLPQGWQVSEGLTSADPDVLTWTSPDPVPMGAAEVEVLTPERNLGPAQVSANGTRVSVELPAGLSAAEVADEGLQVVAGGRQLDADLEQPSAAEAAELKAAAQDLLSELREQPEIAADPGTPGPYEVRSGEYTQPDLAIDGFPGPVEVRGYVVAPVLSGSAGDQRRPMVVFLHGRHTTCYPTEAAGEVADDDPRRGVWPCPDDWAAIPSHRGYARLQELLASQGYLTVSISANGISAHDLGLRDAGTSARAALIQHHLTLWRRWAASSAARAAAPDAVAAAPMADLDRLLLVGHSRGGDGVNRVALNAVAPPAGTGAPNWRVRGVVQLAPTSFGRNPAPGTPTVVMLPSCDGDLFDLQGQEYVDAGRDLHGTGTSGGELRSSVLVIGANHNYFNSEWSPGSVAPSWDDWYSPADPVCGGGSGNVRLAPAEQQQVGATYVAAAAAHFVAGNDAVLPLLDGGEVRAASAGDAGVTSHAIGGRRVPVLVPTLQTTLTNSDDVVARVCPTFDTVRPLHGCHPQDGPPGPHFLPFSYLPDEPARAAIALTWPPPSPDLPIFPGDGPPPDENTVVSVPLPEPVSVSGRTALTLRLASRSGVDGEAALALRLIDSNGRSAVIGEAVLRGEPNDRTSSSLRAQEVRFGLDSTEVHSSGINLSSITKLELVPRSAKGRVWLLDAWGWRTGGGTDTGGLPTPLRVDAGTLEVTEGDADRTVTVPLTVTAAGGGTASRGQIWVGVQTPTGESDHGRVIDLPAVTASGATATVDIEVPIDGDTSETGDVVYSVLVKALHGAAVGQFAGTVLVHDDD